MVDLIGKGGHVRTVPVPGVHRELNEWLAAACIQTGKLFRKVSSAGKPWGDGVTEKLVWHVFLLGHVSGHASKCWRSTIHFRLAWSGHGSAALGSETGSARRQK